MMCEQPFLHGDCESCDSMGINYHHDPEDGELRCGCDLCPYGDVLEPEDMKKSIIPGDRPDKCFLCGRSGPMEVHHMLHGPRRTAADTYGLTVHLCRSCHAALHDRGTYDRELEQIAQEAYEQEHSHEDWMRLFGKDYRE